MENPFRYGEIVRGKDFCPRSALEKRLRNAFRTGENTVILGERRTGKTSLILRAAEKTRGRRLFRLDFRGIKSIEDILQRAARALADLEKPEPARTRLQELFPSLRFSTSTNPITGLPNLHLAPPPQEMGADQLHPLGDLWAELDKQRKTIVALDEFQDILALPDAQEAVTVVIKRVQKLSAMPFCFAGSVRHEMEALLPAEKSRIPKTTRLEVSRDDFDDWEKFLTGKFRTSKRKIDADVLDLIIAFAGNNPGDTLQLCAAIWHGTRTSQRIDAGIVQRGLAGVFRSEHKGYEQTLAEVSFQQLAVLRTLARLGGTSIQSKAFLRDTGITHASSVKAAMIRLVERRLVHHNGAAYRFSNPFFKAWLLREGV